MTIMERDRIKSKLTGEIFEVIGFTDTIVTMRSEDGVTQLRIEVGQLKTFYENVKN
jgi:hypothetical protein